MQEQKQNNLSQSQQNFRVAYLAICFLTLFLSYSNLQNLFSTLCEQFGYKNLGQTAILLIYLAACCSTPFTSLIVKKLGFRKTFLLCSVGYICFEASGLFMVLSVSKSNPLIKLAVYLGSIACGFSSSILWVAQGGYVSQTANQNTKSQLFALFWSIIVSNQIIGNFMGTFMLGKFNTLAYFCLLTCLGILSFILFMFLPKVQVRNQTSQIKLRQELGRIWQIITDKRYKYLIIYFLFPGLSMAFYSTYLYKIVKLTVTQQPQEQQIDYNRRLSIHQGTVFIILGIGQVITGILYRKYSHPLNKFKLATIGSILVQIAGLVSFVCYLQKSYTLCLLAAILWGACEIYMQTNTAVIVSILFKEKVQGFSVSRIFYCIGITSFLLMNIFLSEMKISVFLTIFIIIQTFGTAISVNIKYLCFVDSTKQALAQKSESEC